MNFLAPLFLAGAAAVALPLLFHLIRRSSREKVIFSSLMFLDPSPPRITKRSRLEHILLLLLRSAVLCLLALAFARPFLQKPLAAQPASGKSVRVAILLDASASMRRGDLWANALRRASSVLRALQPSDSFALYTFDDQLRTVLSFAESAQLSPSERPAIGETRLGAAKPGWAGTHLGHALLGATEHLLDERNRDPKEQENTNLRLVVISDLQSGAKLDGLQGFEWPKMLEVQLETVGSSELSNASLQILEENQQLFSAATNAPLRIRINNAAQARTEQLTLRWRQGTEYLGEPLKAYVPPGQNRVSALTPVPPKADSIVLSGDAVDFDNTAFLARPVAKPAVVAYFGSERPDDPNGMRYYLHHAFDQTNLSTRVIALSNAIPAEARSCGLLIIGAPPTTEMLEFSRTLLEQGRTVVLPLRDPAAANAISTLADGMLIAAPEATVPNYALIGKISFQHPLFAPFTDSRYNDFTKIHFWKYRSLNLANFTNANVIASLDSGSPLLTEIPVNKGRLLVLATTWMPSDSQLALSSKFVPLLFGLLEQSAGVRATAHQFSVGDRVPLPPEFKGDIRLPDGSTKPGEGSFPGTDQPGIYTAGEYQFAVNLPAAESRLAPLSMDEIKALGVPLSARADARETAAVEQRKRHLLASETEARQKLWRNFLLAAIGLVLAETWISGRLSRRTLSPSPQTA